ncbi:MAG: hypothetical protein LBS36_07610 [Oscillospiraceae bacterium]|jgi:hypothetical protein|nr:hypothetical protein [Oscillospiraceae bacterium]
MITKTHEKQMQRIIGGAYGLTPESVIIKKWHATEKAIGDEVEIEVEFSHVHTGFSKKVPMWVNVLDCRKAINQFPPKGAEYNEQT